MVFWAAGAIALLILLVVTGGAAWVWGKYHLNRQDLSPIVTLLGASVAAWVALKQVRIALRQAETAAERHTAQTNADQQRRITESFSKAVEQLGSDKLEVRLGGIYSLERISKESPDDYWTVMENLTAFVRERSRRNEAERTSQDFEQRVKHRAFFLWQEAGQPDGQAGYFWAEVVKQDELGEPPATDIAAVLTVIKRRSERSWEREGANFWRLDFSRAILKGAYLVATGLNRANLEGADLKGANLFYAHLEEANLEGADLKGANLEGAYFERADLTGAHLEKANLFVAHLKGANLRGAHLEGANLLGVSVRP